MTTEPIDDRALAALRLIDAETGAAVTSAITITAPGGVFVRSRRGLYVITKAPGFDDYTASFAAAPATPAADLQLVFTDPSGQYLPRRAAVRLPRDASVANAALATSVFQPIDVRLYPSPAARVATGSAVVRARVADSAGDEGLGGALLRVLSGGVVLARGLSDDRGEALVVVPGIRVTPWSGTDGAEIDVIIEAAFDATTAGDPGIVPDPDALEAKLAQLKKASVARKLASRREVVVSIAISLA